MITMGTWIRMGWVLSGCLACMPVSGQVSFKEETQVRDLLQRRYEVHASSDKLWDVWCVQIAATTDRRNMEGTRSAFNRKYPYYKLQSSYSEPYYKLQVGAYFHKHRAESVLHILKRDYPGAYLVRGKVKLTELTD